MEQNQGIKKHTLSELEKLYQDGVTIDRAWFQEARTNVLLMSGEHYTKRNSQFINQMRTFRDVSDNQKVRLTRNHTGCIGRRIQNHILSGAPGISFKAHNEQEMQDQKNAELNESMWKFLREKNDYDDLDDEFSDDFHIIGEVWGEVYFDQTDGFPLTDDQGMAIINGMTGQQVISGMVKIRNIPGYNVVRDPSARRMKDSRHFIVHEMVNTELMKELFPDHAEKISSTSDESISVFDSAKSEYRTANDETLVKKYYFKKCARYPQGYFYITVKGSILADGEFPEGKFPLVGQYFLRVSGTARGISWIRDGRPYQVEINRTASKIAEHHISLGDDKLITNDGADMSEGIGLPGIRRVNVSGEKPTILKGSTGQQYVPYLESNIKEYYEAMGVNEEQENAQQDLMPVIFKSAKQRAKFKSFVGRYERFKKQIALLSMDYARMYFPDEVIVKAISRNERINISEFKALDNTSCRVVAEPTSEDIETRFGRQMMIKDTLQYVGSKMDPEQIGQLIRNAPFGNLEGSGVNLTLKYDRATNLILALDRGEDPAPFKYEDHKYMLQRLTTRVSLGDFQGLPQQTQQNYYNKIVQFENLAAQELRAIQEAQAGFIPVDGFLVTVQLRTPDPKDPTKMRLVRLPYGSLQWLVTTLEKQGYAQDQLEHLATGVQSEIAGQVTAGGNSYLSQLPVGINQTQGEMSTIGSGAQNGQ